MLSDMSNKQIYIDFIVDQLNNGIVERSDVMAIFVKKWQMSDRSFDRYFKIAKEQHSEAMQKIKDAKEAVTIEQTKKDAERLYLSRAERMEIAFKIAMGKYRSVGGELFVPTDSDRLKALDYLAKMDGDYKPAKTAQTDSEGNDIPFIEQLIIAAKGVKRKEEVEN